MNGERFESVRVTVLQNRESEAAQAARVREDILRQVADNPAPKGLIFLVGVLGFVSLVELGVAVVVTL